MEKLLKTLEEKASSGAKPWLWLLVVVAGLFSYWAFSRTHRLERRRDVMRHTREVHSKIANAEANQKKSYEHLRIAHRTEKEIKNLSRKIKALDEELASARNRVNSARNLSEL